MYKFRIKIESNRYITDNEQIVDNINLNKE